MAKANAKATAKPKLKAKQNRLQCCCQLQNRQQHQQRQQQEEQCHCQCSRRAFAYKSKNKNTLKNYFKIIFHNIKVRTINNWMPSAVVSVKQQQQQQQQQQQHHKQAYTQQATQCKQRRRRQQRKYFVIDACTRTEQQQQQRQRQWQWQNCGAVNAANTYTTNTTTTTTTTATSTTERARNSRAATSRTTTRIVFLIMLAFSIIQQQQQHQQHEHEQQLQQQQQLTYNGVYAAAIVATQIPQAIHYNNNNNNNNNNHTHNDSYVKNSSNSNASNIAEAKQYNYVAAATTATTTAVAAMKQPQPQPRPRPQSRPQPQMEATNHTFTSLAFVDAYANAIDADDEHFAVRESLPIFDFGMPRNITGRTGHTEAILKCRVDSLLDKSVSWIRKRDLHILTVGTATYTSDKRFQVTESKDARDWTLHVKAPQTRDSGIYECQVNTEPKMSMAFQLNIIEISPDAKAIISGPPDLHFKVGSAIILNCVVLQPSIKDIGPIYWYRGEHMITPFDADDDDDDDGNDDDDNAADDDVTDVDNDVEVGSLAVVAATAAAAVAIGDSGNGNAGKTNVIEKSQAHEKQDNAIHNDIQMTNDMQKDFATRIAMESQLGDTLKSRLRISNAQTADTGNYTCQPTTASSASVMVHVINDEKPAAMQKSAAVALFAFAPTLPRLSVALPGATELAVFMLRLYQLQRQRQHRQP